ncbi:camp-dependent protein kinase catalytic subunit [Phlyctochytrium planicorne]|nr:camp-dependent protein kinase catalytic subunit [Phlyctochytrium planicorne]
MLTELAFLGSSERCYWFCNLGPKFWGGAVRGKKPPQVTVSRAQSSISDLVEFFAILVNVVDIFGDDSHSSLAVHFPCSREKSLAVDYHGTLDFASRDDVQESTLALGVDMAIKGCGHEESALIESVSCVTDTNAYDFQVLKTEAEQLESSETLASDSPIDDIAIGVVESLRRKTSDIQEIDGTDVLRCFTLGRVLGAGSSGKVFAITCIKTGKSLALKRRQQVLSMVDVEKIVMEKAVGCKQLVQVYHSFDYSRYTFMVMDRFTMDLEDFRYLNKVTFEEIKFIAFQLLRGIEHLHAHHFVHRDIKCENVFLRLDRDGRIMSAVLGDFGLAMDADNPDHILAGTVQYASPEMLVKIPYSYPIDYFAIGVLLFLLLTGEFPFGDTTNALEVRNAMERGFRFPASQPYPKRAVDLICKLLILGPERRLGSQGAGQALSHRFFAKIPPCWHENRFMEIGDDMDVLYEDTLDVVLQSMEDEESGSGDVADDDDEEGSTDF